MQSYSTNPKCTVDLKETGIYTLLLKVRDQAGTVVTKNYVISNGGPDSGMEQTTEGQKVIYGKLVTVTADNAGNGARYTFSCRHSSAADWTTLQKDSTSPATSFRPSLPGTYTIRIQANKNGTITTQTKTITAVIPDEVYRMLVLVNEERKAAGKPGYVLDTDLVYLAMIRSEEIQKKYSHIRPDGESFPTIFDEYYIGYSTTVGENIGQGFSTPEAVMKAWMKSTTHKSAILHDQYTKIGIGFDGKYWVQLFSD